MNPLRLVIVLIALIAAPHLYAAEAEPAGLKVQAEYFSGKAKDPAGKVVERQGLLIYLINKGDGPVTVLTDKLDKSAGPDYASGGFNVEIGYAAEVRKDGHLLVPSFGDLAPVALLPGDAAIVKSTIDLAEYQGGDIRVTYRVEPSWGSRWSVWSGTTSATAIFRK